MHAGDEAPSYSVCQVENYRHGHDTRCTLLQVERLLVDCRALQPEQGSFAQLLALFRGSSRLKRLDILCCAAVDVSAAIPMLPSLVSLEVLSIEELDGLADHGTTLQVCLLCLFATASAAPLPWWPQLQRTCVFERQRCLYNIAQQYDLKSIRLQTCSENTQM